MKNLSISLLVASTFLSITLFCPPVQAQTYSGNLNLSSQAQVDAFNYTNVTGKLTINGADIDDLSPLSMLTTVGGALDISGNAVLEQMVNGFANLTNVGGYLLIDENPSLATVDDFGSLTNLGGGLFFSDNPNMVDFAGFSTLAETGDNIDFWNNDSLVSISGFGSLHTVGWSLEIGGNPALTAIPDFESLKTIQSSLFILDNPSLPSIHGFNNLEHVNWSLSISGNESLNCLEGFQNYFQANNPYTGGGTLDISNNGSELPNPTTIQDILDAGPCSTCTPGDTDGDGDIDTGDITTAIINFTGASGSGKGCEDGDTDDDGDVDTGDLTFSIQNFTGAQAGTPDVPDLVYDPATGNVTIDADGADVISFSLQSGPFNAADFSELPAGLTDNIASQIGWTSFNLFSGLTGTANLGAILPAGLDLAQLEAALTTASYGLALSGGGGGGRLDIIIPEPASMVLLGLGAVALVRRRRAA